MSLDISVEKLGIPKFLQTIIYDATNLDYYCFSDMHLGNEGAYMEQ